MEVCQTTITGLCRPEREVNRAGGRHKPAMVFVVR